MLLCFMSALPSLPKSLGAVGTYRDLEDEPLALVVGLKGVEDGREGV